MLRWTRLDPIAPKARCVFLDRDGVINERIVDGYVLSWDDFRWCGGALDALARLARGVGAGVALAVVSNQSCIGRGLLSETELRAIMGRMVDELAARGIVLDAWYACPHAPADGCACRKPADAMLRACAASFGISLSRSYLVGDSVSDIEAGRSAGCRTWHVGPSGDTQLGRAVDEILACERAIAPSSSREPA